MPQTWASRKVRAVLAVRWEMLPPDAQLAAGALTAHAWAIIRLRLAGLSCGEIAAKQGVSKAAVYDCCKKAIETLSRKGGRLVSVDAVCRAGRQDALPEQDGTVQTSKAKRCRPQDRVENRMESLADAWLAGEVTSQAADEQGRALERKLLSLDTAG